MGGLICIILVVLIMVCIGSILRNRHIFTRENTTLDRVLVKLQRRVYGDPFFLLNLSTCIDNESCNHSSLFLDKPSIFLSWYLKRNKRVEITKGILGEMPKNHLCFIHASIVISTPLPLTQNYPTPSTTINPKPYRGSSYTQPQALRFLGLFRFL